MAFKFVCFEFGFSNSWRHIEFKSNILGWPPSGWTVNDERWWLIWIVNTDFCWYSTNGPDEQVNAEPYSLETTNPLEVAIQEIVEVQQPPEEPSARVSNVAVRADFSSQMTRLADKLKSLRESSVLRRSRGPSSEAPQGRQVHVCHKCGREYKYQSFLHVHLKRKCTWK